MMTLDRQALLANAQLASSAVSKKPTAPELGCLLGRLEADHLVLEGTDNEMMIATHTSARVEKTFPPFLIATDAFLGGLRNVPDAEVRLGWTAAELTMQGDITHYVLPLLDHTKFPGAKSFDSTGQLVLTARQFTHLIAHVVYCTAGANRGNMASVLLDLASDAVTAWASDGRHLAMWKTTLASPLAKPAKLMFGERSCTILQRVLRSLDDSSEVTMTYCDNLAEFTGDGLRFRTLLMAGLPMPFQKLLGGTFTGECKLDATQLELALRQTQVVAEPGNTLAKLTFTPGQLFLESTGRGNAKTHLFTDGGPAKPVPCQVDAELPLTMLKAMMFGERITCKFDGGKTVVFQSDSEDGQFLYMLSCCRQVRQVP